MRKNRKYFQVKVDAQIIDLPEHLQKQIAQMLVKERETAFKDGYEDGKLHAEREKRNQEQQQFTPVNNYKPAPPAPLELAAKVLKNLEHYQDWEQNSILNAIAFQIKQQRERLAQGALTEKERINSDQSAYYADRVLSLTKLKDAFKDLLG